MLLIKIDGYGDRMKDRVRSVVWNKSKVRAQHGSLDGERNVKSPAIVKCENWHAMRGIVLFFRTRARRRARLDSLSGKPLFDRTFELVILRTIVITRAKRCTVRMAAVVTVIAEDRGRWYDDAGAVTNTGMSANRTRRTFRVAEGTHARTRAVIGVNGRLTYHRYARVIVTRNARTTAIRYWQHLGLRKAQPVARGQNLLTMLLQMIGQLHAKRIPSVEALDLDEKVHRFAEALLKSQSVVLGCGRGRRRCRRRRRRRMGNAVNAVFGVRVHRCHNARLLRLLSKAL